MGLLDWALLALVGLCAAAAVRVWRKSGGCSCGSGCDGSCAHCTARCQAKNCTKK